MKKYELVIIGSGPGGYTAAEYASKQGIKTLIIEKSNLGGICLNYGCIPTKALLKSAKIFKMIKNAHEYGIDGINENSIKLNWNKILNRKNNVVDTLRNGIKNILKNANVDLINGNAEIISNNSLKVNDEIFEFEKLIIATGSKPKLFKLPGFDKGYLSKKIITSDDALSLPKIPKKIVIVGGGVIGVEFAILYAELGSEVIIVQGLDRILELLDKEISSEVTKLLEKNKIKIIVNAQIKSFENDQLVYNIDNKIEKISADYFLVSIGRYANIDSIKNLKLELSSNGQILTDEQMRTSIKNIYAIGDCTSKLMLAHVAHKGALVAIDTILNKKNSLNLNDSPSCIYTFPEVAMIGKTEEYLIENKIEYCKVKLNMNYLGKALVDGEVAGFLKLLLDKKYGSILGCHVIGPTASDIIAEIALAINLQATVYDLANTIHPHPTISEIIFEVAKKALIENFKDKNWYENN